MDSLSVHQSTHLLPVVSTAEAIPFDWRHRGRNLSHTIHRCTASRPTVHCSNWSTDKIQLHWQSWRHVLQTQKVHERVKICAIVHTHEYTYCLLIHTQTQSNNINWLTFTFTLSCIFHVWASCACDTQLHALLETTIFWHIENIYQWRSLSWTIHHKSSCIKDNL